MVWLTKNNAADRYPRLVSKTQSTDPLTPDSYHGQGQAFPGSRPQASFLDSLWCRGDHRLSRDVDRNGQADRRNERSGIKDQRKVGRGDRDYRRDSQSDLAGWDYGERKESARQ